MEEDPELQPYIMQAIQEGAISDGDMIEVEYEEQDEELYPEEH